MKKKLLTLFATLAFCGSISAQYVSYWADCFHPWDNNPYETEEPFVAFIQIDGEYVSEQDNWEALEIAYFVGDECRGHDFLAYYPEEGDPYPILEGAIYYTDSGDEVTFKLFDHATGVEYEGTPSIPILTGEMHVELYFDYDEAVVLNFTSPSFDGLVLANDDSELEEDKKNTALITAFVNVNGNENVTNVMLEGRTLYRNQNWNTLCLPFDVEDFGGTPLEGATVMELDLDGKYNADGESDEAGTYQTGFDATDGTLYLYFKDVEKIEAGKPYIVKWEDEDLENITDPVFSGVTISNTTPTAITFAEEKVQFIGTFTYTEYTDENKYVLLLGSDSNLFYPDGDEPTTVGAFRAYFQLQNGLKAGEPDQTGGIKNFVLNFGDGETSIEEIVNGKSSNGKSLGAWYDLSGRKLSGKPAQRGIYINNNKKSFIK